MSEDNKEELRPSKMRGVAFPKAKYGVIVAIIIIVIVNLIGFLAACTSTVSLVPQIYKSYVLKSTNDISFLMLLNFFSSVL